MLKRSLAIKIAVIVLVVISYSAVINGEMNKVFSQTLTDSQINDRIILTNMDAHKNLSYSLPDKPAYILRLDDVQTPLWSEISMKIINDTLNRNMSISVGVIPDRDRPDPDGILEFLREHENNPRFEIVQHGFSHSDYEYANLSMNEAQSITMKGLRELYRDYNTYPVTFIPPNNALPPDKNSTPDVLGGMGFRIISTSGDIRYEGKILNVGCNVVTKKSGTSTLKSTEEIIKGSEEDFKKQNLSVIMIHPQDYAGADKRTLDPSKYASYLEMLQELKNTKAQSITFRDLLKEGETT